MTWYTFNKAAYALNQNFQIKVFLVRQVSGAVSEGVCLFFRCDRQRGTHALPEIDIQACPFGSELVLPHRLISILLVPELSPRVMKFAPASAIFWKASTAVGVPLCRQDRQQDQQ